MIAERCDQVRQGTIACDPAAVTLGFEHRRQAYFNAIPRRLMSRRPIQWPTGWFAITIVAPEQTEDLRKNGA